MVPLVDVFKFNLILKQCERDNKAFETLFDFYYPRIKLHIHKKFPDACADDVAQEFFLQLMKSHGLNTCKIRRRGFLRAATISQSACL